MSELTIDQLERIVSPETDHAKRRTEDREAMELVRFLEDVDAERAADSVDEVLVGWRDDLTGLPPEGMEGPRFRTEREREFMNWVASKAGARTRAIRYPHLDEVR